MTTAERNRQNKLFWMKFWPKLGLKHKALCEFGDFSHILVGPDSYSHVCQNDQSTTQRLLVKGIFIRYNLELILTISTGIYVGNN